MKRSSRGTADAQTETIALIGNYVPRQCGIATFTTDLRTALAGLSNDRDVWAVAMNDRPDGYSYPEQVRFEVSQSHFPEYRLAADFLNMNRVDLVCVQHEFGIYGGDDGAHLLALLRELRMPVLTTLHTVLSNPTQGQRSVMEELVTLSDRLVVMSRLAVDILTSTYSVPESKIEFIPHGIPDVQFIDPNYYKDQFGVEGRKVILTFGLLGPGKGLEHVIDALPRISEQFPEVVYLIVGATHPNIKRESGESYRVSLQHRARQLGVQDNVKFHNRFVSLEKLCEFLICADLYITPYLNRDQITSGTLAYAMGAGKAVISTPYLYAEEMLADGRGRLVPFSDPEAIADQVLNLFGNPNDLNALRRKVYKYTRNMVWKEVGQSYVNLFADLKTDRSRHRQAVYPARSTDLSINLPEINLDHLRLLTDDTGILQHARFMIPNRTHGYATDDNARALITVMTAAEVASDAKALGDLANRYLGFLDFAFDNKSGRFRNFLSYGRRWSSAPIDEDCHGRSLRGLGVTILLSRNESQTAMAMDLFERALPACDDLESPRAIALALLGCVAYAARFKGDRNNHRTLNMLSDRLLEMYRRNATESWPWIDAKVTYNNGRIPQALIAAGRSENNPELVRLGLDSLEWLVSIQGSPSDHFVPIGNKGWYPRGGPRARYDQQPIEACAMIDACAEAFAATGDSKWSTALVMCFDWFLGRNDLGTPLVDFTTGGCRDGLASNGVNQNQGAESTLCWLMSLIAVHKCRATWGTVPPARHTRAKSSTK